MKNLEFKLIDNTYSPEEAKEVVLTLIKSKIKFLNQEIFSQYLQKGEDCPHHEKRILELNQDIGRLISEFNKIKDSNIKFKVNCTVNVEVDQEQLV